MKAGSTTQIPAAKSRPRSCTNAYRPLRGTAWLEGRQVLRGHRLLIRPPSPRPRVRAFVLMTLPACTVNSRCPAGPAPPGRHALRAARRARDSATRRGSTRSA
jgi:hypothetical protein